MSDSSTDSVAGFTPGPWTATLGELDGGRSEFYIGAAPYFRPIVAVVHADDDAQLYGAAVEANARLIAAAPDLLVALRSLATYTRSLGWPGMGPPAPYQRAVEAIAKAEGRS